jgi:SAM-dependent methyltransferase
MNYSKAWQDKEHSRQFGKAIKKRNLFLFLDKFNLYLPARCLNFLVNTSTGKRISVLDVGCAGGDFYAYLSCVTSSQKWDYEGLDISEPAIEIAKKHYGENLFKRICKDEDLVGKYADIVISIDVLIHHVEPFQHLEKLFDCAKKFLVIELRTRETGDTVLNPELSCQRNYGEWVPFIVFNMNQLYEKILSLTHTPLKITCFKDYQILGGERRRFLPKELYEEESKTAVTTLLIEKCDNEADNQITEYEYIPKGKFKKGFGFNLLSYLSENRLIGRMVVEKYSEKIKNTEEVLRYTDIINKKVDLNNISDK